MMHAVRCRLLDASASPCCSLQERAPWLLYSRDGGPSLTWVGYVPSILPACGAATKAEVLAWDRSWPQSEQGRRLLGALRWAVKGRGWRARLPGLHGCSRWRSLGVFVCLAQVTHPPTACPLLAGAAAPRAGCGRRAGRRRWLGSSSTGRGSCGRWCSTRAAGGASTRRPEGSCGLAAAAHGSPADAAVPHSSCQIKSITLSATEYATWGRGRGL